MSFQDVVPPNLKPDFSLSKITTTELEKKLKKGTFKIPSMNFSLVSILGYGYYLDSLVLGSSFICLVIRDEIGGAVSI